jgi:hypothetical protein
MAAALSKLLLCIRKAFSEWADRILNAASDVISIDKMIGFEDS